MSKGNKFLSIPLALILSWIINYIRGFTESNTCIRTWKKTFSKFEEKNCLNSFAASIMRLFYIAVLI